MCRRLLARKKKKNSVDILDVECTGYRKSGSIRTWDSLKEDLDVPCAHVSCRQGVWTATWGVCMCVT